MVVAISTPGASAARVRARGARQICSTQDHLSGGGCLVVRCGADLVFGPAGLLTAQGGDGGGAVQAPVHAGEFEALADDRFAAGLNDAGAGEQAALAEPVVAHARGVVLEVAQRGVELVFLDPGQGELAAAAQIIWLLI